jgi:hypothetical protein
VAAEKGIWKEPIRTKRWFAGGKWEGRQVAEFLAEQSSWAGPIRSY